MFGSCIFKLEVEFLWKNGQNSSYGAFVLQLGTEFILNLAFWVNFKEEKQNYRLRK